MKALHVSHSEREPPGFSLIELMVVILIMILVAAFIAPAFTSIKSGGDVTSAAYTIEGILKQARTYAVANNTYTWVGFYEENTTDTTPTTTAPPYTGKGRVVLVAICSNDGTKIYRNSDSNATLPTTAYKQLGKITKIEGLHVTDIGQPPSNPNLRRRPTRSMVDQRLLTPIRRRRMIISIVSAAIAAIPHASHSSRKITRSAKQ